MPRFEVYIPAADADSFNVTFRVDAANWMAALKTGMQKLGEQGSHGNNVLVDVQDDQSVHVTEPESGRVFRIRELTEEEANRAEVKKPAPPPVEAAPTAKRDPDATIPGTPSPFAASDTTLPGRPAFNAPATAPATKLDPAVAVAMVSEVASSSLTGTGAGVPIHAGPTPLRRDEQPSSRGPLPVGHLNRAEAVVELERPTSPVVGIIGRPRATKSERESLEDVLAEVFERVDEINRQTDTREAMYFLLDLALAKIPAESGSVLHADTANGDLSFFAARGPKASELLAAKLVIPHGQGVVGFCTLEGVSVALSDVQKDERFYPNVSERLKYATKNVLTAPMMTHGRAFGCFQVLNKKDGKPFSAYEMGLLSYIAHQGALYLNAKS